MEYAHPNYIRRINAIDPRLWALYNPGGLKARFNTSPFSALPAGYNVLTDADIDLVEGSGAGGSPVVIGSLDTGVDTDHPDFTGKLILGWDWVNGDALPEDDNGHGTHTIGIMVDVIKASGANVKVHVQKVCTPRAAAPHPPS